MSGYRREKGMENEWISPAPTTSRAERKRNEKINWVRVQFLEMFENI